MDEPLWQQRFRCAQVYTAALARGTADRGLVVGTRDGLTTQLFAWAVSSGQVTPVTQDKHGVAQGWIDPAGEFVYYLRDEDGSELGHLVRVAFAGGPAQDLTPALPNYTLRGVGFDGNGDLLAINPVNAEGFALYIIDLRGDPGEPRLVWRDRWEVQGALLSASGDIAACWSTRRAQGVRRYTLLAFDTASGELIGELNDGPQARVVGVRFSPVRGDSRILAGTTRSGYVRPVIWDPRSGQRRDIATSGLDGDVQPADWSGDARQILLCHLAGAQSLLLADIANQTLRTINHPAGTFYTEISGGPALLATGSIAGVRRTAERPNEVVEMDTEGGHRVLLSLGPAPSADPWRSVTFPSSDGTPIQAWVATPPGEGPFPTVLEIHGGPHNAVYERYDPGAQMWLDHGYAWASVNYRGSTGFGRHFQEQIWGDLGRWELEDIVAARSWLVDYGIAANDEVFASGGSYGGFMTLYALGKRPELWIGGMAIAAIADYAAAYEQSSDALKAAMAGWIGGTPEQRPESYRNSSPTTYAANVSAPIVVVQLRSDTRTPAPQMQAYAERMHMLGKDLQLEWLEGGHKSFGPEVLVHSCQILLDFAQRTLDRRRSGP
ncbi:MAG TPA: prolyl oligopeptidase family serine peptidase [Candidatus Limnocylindrales bacterium]